LDEDGVVSGIGGGLPGVWWESGVGVSADGSSEEEDVGFGSVNLIMSPASALLNTKTSPLLFAEESSLGHLLEDVLWEDNVPILIEVIKVLVRVLDLVWEVWHCGEITEDTWSVCVE
jgi:hypothetical protein